MKRLVDPVAVAEDAIVEVNHRNTNNGNNAN